MSLPADSHVHSEFSWDAARRGTGSMERTCARAVEIGLPALAFTEHLDHTAWLDYTAPPLDVDGYLESVERCRDLFPQLRILTGLEIGEPHWHPEPVAKLLAGGRFERVLGSLHSLRVPAGIAEANSVYLLRPAADVVRDYLTELPQLIAGSDVFEALTHIDYPARHWPADEGRFDPYAFEEEFRVALRALAGTGRALEINTRRPLDEVVLRWWHQEGGDAVTFGSDAHEPDALARGFADAAAMAQAHGFRPGPRPYDWWSRS
ncbi:PHP domain-containing protein [Catenuloplanes indicus]|uniref:Histidinol-phosphatase n=1 Tax=Catenuloplanes indicus TaxID=137267 RepID=A0AAE3W754_9ACTN|nr:PHP domain-containing protein [Catenuloplanes indicus]MDQ0371203.1 histidinol-phosphatase (PHP family) [Catenuloplanes indicus]